MIKIHSIEIQKNQSTIFPQLFGQTPNRVRLPPIEICENLESQFFPTIWKDSKSGQTTPN